MNLTIAPAKPGSENNTDKNMTTPKQSEKPHRGENYGVYWHGGGWYCAAYCADGQSHYQQTGRQTLAEANAEAEALEAGLDPYPQD